MIFILQFISHLHNCNYVKKQTNQKKPNQINDQRNMTAQLYCIIKPNSAQLQNKSSCLQPVAVNTDNAAPVIYFKSKCHGIFHTCC